MALVNVSASFEINQAIRKDTYIFTIKDTVPYVPTIASERFPLQPVDMLILAGMSMPRRKKPTTRSSAVLTNRFLRTGDRW